MTDDPGRSGSRRTGTAGTGSTGTGTGGGTGSGTSGADFDFGSGRDTERESRGTDRGSTGSERVSSSTTRAGAASGGTDIDRTPSRRHTPENRSTETKAAFKTTEFIAYLAVLAGLLIAGLVVDDAGDGGLGAQKVWLYATILTVGYMVSRGFAKSGSRDPYTDDD